MSGVRTRDKFADLKKGKKVECDCQCHGPFHYLDKCAECYEKHLPPAGKNRAYQEGENKARLVREAHIEDLARKKEEGLQKALEVLEGMNGFGEFVKVENEKYVNLSEAQDKIQKLIDQK